MKNKKYSALVMFYNRSYSTHHSKNIKKLQLLIMLEGCTEVTIYDLRGKRIYIFKKVICL